jgi:hypothetical protein
MSVEPPDRAVSEQKALRLLTDAEKVQIIHLLKSEYSWTIVSSILKRPLSTCHSSYEKWKKTEMFACARERRWRILKDVGG